MVHNSPSLESSECPLPSSDGRTIVCARVPPYVGAYQLRCEGRGWSTIVHRWNGRRPLLLNASCRAAMAACCAAAVCGRVPAQARGSLTYSTGRCPGLPPVDLGIRSVRRHSLEAASAWFFLVASLFGPAACASRARSPSPSLRDRQLRPHLVAHRGRGLPAAGEEDEGGGGRECGAQ